MLKYHSTVLFVKDIERAKHLYCELMGIPVETDMGKNVILKSGITLWEIAESNIIVTELGRERLSLGNKSELYFETDEIEKVYALMAKNEIRFLHNIHVEPWGQRTLRFFDYDENIIEVGETIQIFLGRMANAGLSIEEIAVKTGMTDADISKILSSPDKQ